MNQVVANLMNDIPRVRELLSDLGEKDEFVGGMLKISHAVEKYPYKQKGYLGILRSDYMFDEETLEPKLIEFNTIASSFGPLAWGANQLHQKLIKKYNPEIDIGRIQREKNPTNSTSEGLKQAYDLYFGTENAAPDKAICLVIIDKGEKNVNDMGLIIDQLFEKFSIQSRYVRFDEVNKNSELKEGKLYYEEQEVAVVYFRHGYDSDHYSSDEDWKARETLELSQAIKCPSMDLQLLTLKKIQEVLGIKKVWEEFNSTNLEDIRHFFIGMWGLSKDDEETRSIIEKAKANPEKYVLKTQREGGGHNYFGDQVREQLEKEDELWKYSLMARIFPISFPATLMRNTEIWQGDAVSELGVFGKLLVKFDEENTQLQNEELG